jgi:hypothetical protein
MTRRAMGKEWEAEFQMQRDCQDDRIHTGATLDCTKRCLLGGSNARGDALVLGGPNDAHNHDAAPGKHHHPAHQLSLSSLPPLLTQSHLPWETACLERCFAKRIQASFIIAANHSQYEMRDAQQAQQANARRK